MRLVEYPKDVLPLSQAAASVPNGVEWGKTGPKLIPPLTSRNLIVTGPGHVSFRWAPSTDVASKIPISLSDETSLRNPTNLVLLVSVMFIFLHFVDR